MWTIVVAGGGGRRFGRTSEGASKQFVELAGRRVLDHSVDAARSVSTGVVVVVPADQTAIAVPGADHVVAGGETRADSVRAGLACVPDDAAIVLVHDAARPAADTALFARVIAAVRAGADGAIPVVDVTDTLRRRRGGVVDRSELVAVQTPQGFAAAVLRRAHESGGEATDDASLVEAVGGSIEHVDGEPTNRKLTHPGDEVLLAAVLGGRAHREAAT